MHSLREMCPNKELKYGPKITPHLDTFHVVIISVPCFHNTVFFFASARFIKVEDGKSVNPQVLLFLSVMIYEIYS